MGVLSFSKVTLEFTYESSGFGVFFVRFLTIYLISLKVTAVQIYVFFLTSELAIYLGIGSFFLNCHGFSKYL